MNGMMAACTRCHSPVEKGDLRCAVCGLAVPQTRLPTEQTTVRMLRCSGCGAATEYAPEHQSLACSFCGDVVVEETVVDPVEQTEGYLPFTLTTDQAHRALRKWLDSLGWFRPSDLVRSARLEALRPIWWVGWLVDVEAQISWAADSNAGSRRSAWAPHAGTTEAKFESILISASRGLSLKETNELAPGFDVSVVNDAPSRSADAVVEQFDVQRSQARRQISAAIDHFATQYVQRSCIPGSRFRNVRTSSVLSRLRTRRYSFPAYILAYRYKHQLYRVVICGQDADRLAGSAPVSYAKIFLVVAIGVFVLGGLAMLIAAG